MDLSFVDGSSSGDKVCEDCGQIFSAAAAFLEHRKRSSCRSSISLDGRKGCEPSLSSSSESKRYRCPFKNCDYSFMTQSGLGKHRFKVHGCVRRKRGPNKGRSMAGDAQSPLRQFLEAQQDDQLAESGTEGQRVTAIGGSVEARLDHLGTSSRSTRVSRYPIKVDLDSEPIPMYCPMRGCDYVSTGRSKRQIQLTLWSHLTNAHPGSGIDVIGGPLKCALKICGWSGFSAAELDLHYRIYHNNEYGVLREGDSAAESSTSFLKTFSRSPTQFQSRCAVVTPSVGSGASQFEADYDRVCSVLGCCVSQKMLKPDGKPYEFFSFPKNETRLNRWTKVANQRFPHFRPKPNDAICELHFRKRDLLCAKPGLLDGADPHRDESLSEGTSDSDENDIKSTRFTAQGVSEKSEVDPGATRNSLLSLSVWNGGDQFKEGSSLYSNDNSSSDEEAPPSAACCGSEIPVMKKRVRRVEKNCNLLFYLLRGLLQGTHAEQLANGKGTPSALQRWQRHCEMASNASARGVGFQSNEPPSHSTADVRFTAKAPVFERAGTTSLRKERSEASSPSTGFESSGKCNGENADGMLIRPETNAFSKSPKASSSSASEGGEEAPEQKKPRLHTISTSHADSLSEWKHPRIDRERLLLLHPTKDRQLDKEETCYYLYWAILLQHKQVITKSKIRLLGPSWIQIVDDDDIVFAIESLTRNGLLVEEKSTKNRPPSYRWASRDSVHKLEKYLSGHGAPSSK